MGRLELQAQDALSGNDGSPLQLTYCQFGEKGVLSLIFLRNIFPDFARSPFWNSSTTEYHPEKREKFNT